MVYHRRCRTDRSAGPLLQLPTILRGKHKTDFAPHVDCGDHVIIINAQKAVLTGKKLEQKVLPSSLRLDRRPEGRSVTDNLMSAEPRKGDDAGCKGYAARTPPSAARL